MMKLIVSIPCMALLLSAPFAVAQTPERSGNYVAVDQCKAVKPPDGAYEESHYEYHCTFRYQLADASKGKACILATPTPAPTYPQPCRERDEARFEEPLSFTVGAPSRTVYKVTQGSAVIGEVTVVWDEVREWLTVTGNYGGNYKATSPCGGGPGGSC